MPRDYSLTFLALLWSGWCFLHSLLIARGVSSRLQKTMGHYCGYYRLAYNVFSLLSLLPVLSFQLHLEEQAIFVWPWPWNLAKFCLYAAAFFLFYSGARVYDLQYMLGMRQIRGKEDAEISMAEEFTTRGILGYVRHPWYSGAILLVWAFGDITDVTLVSKTVLTGYIVVGTLLEERKLVRRIGAPYREYRRKVPMYFPWKIR